MHRNITLPFGREETTDQASCLSRKLLTMTPLYRQASILDGVKECKKGLENEAF